MSQTHVRNFRHWVRPHKLRHDSHRYRWHKPWREVRPLWEDPCWGPQVVERESYIKQQSALKKKRDKEVTACASSIVLTHVP